MLENIESVEGLTVEQQASINALAKGLSDKNSELLGKVSSGTASAAELEALRKFKQNSEVKEAEDQKNWQELEKLNNDAHKVELDGLKTESESDKNLIKTLLIDNGLSTALDAANINPALKDGAIAMLKNDCEITDGKAKIGEKSLSEAVKEWAQTDIGKAYTLAADNSGTGSGGGTLETGNKKMSEMSEPERTALHKEDPAKFQRLLAEMQST